MKRSDSSQSTILLCCRDMLAAGVTFKHNNDNLTVKEFYDKYHSSLPQLIVVTQGYCGDIGLEEFSIGQVGVFAGWGRVGWREPCVSERYCTKRKINVSMLRGFFCLESFLMIFKLFGKKINVYRKYPSIPLKSLITDSTETL